MKYVISIVLSYLIGGFSPSTLLGRKKGINIRDAGSKNAGASNTFLLIGPKFGIFVALADILKGAICVFLAEIYAPELIHIGVLAGTAAVIGHTTDNNDKILRNGEEMRYIDRPAPDEILKLYSGGMNDGRIKKADTPVSGEA